MRCSTRQYRVLAVSVFMGAGPRRKFVHSILSFLPNGNWQVHDLVQVRLPSAASVSRSTLVLLVAKGLCLSLASANLLVFNRSRWTKNDECVGQLGLLQSYHGLPEARVQGLGTHGNALWRRLSRTRHQFAMSQKVFLALHGSEQLAVPHAPLFPKQDGCHAPAASPNANSFCARAGSVENVDSFAAENATTRSLAEHWIDGDPLRDCVLARAIMELAMAALRRQLFVSSERSERVMYGEGARRDNRAVGGACRLPCRMLVAARCDPDENFQRHMAIMFNSSILWRLLPRNQP